MHQTAGRVRVVRTQVVKVEVADCHHRGRVGELSPQILCDDGLMEYVLGMRGEGIAYPGQASGDPGNRCGNGAEVRMQVVNAPVLHAPRQSHRLLEVRSANVPVFADDLEEAGETIAGVKQFLPEVLDFPSGLENMRQGRFDPRDGLMEAGIVRQPKREDLERQTGFFVRQYFIDDKGLGKPRKYLEDVSDFHISFFHGSCRCELKCRGLRFQQL